MNAVVFGLLALAADPSSNALAAHVPAPLPTAPSRFGTFAKFASDRNARTVALTALLLVALGFGLPYWLASRALASAERDLAYEHKLEQTYNEYEAERERVEAEMQHEQQLLEIINAKRDAQLVPKQVTDDIDRAFASVPGLRGSDDPHNRIEFSETRWDGSTVTISGRTWYLENATNFGQALGALDDRTRFTDVQTTHRELTSAPTPDAPDGELVYDFVVRAKYTPPAAK